jgi:integrase
LLWTRLDWCRLDDSVPRIGIPRAKGDRGGNAGGRWIFLGPDAVRCLKAIPRPSGSEHLTVPGDKPGQPLYRLNEAWRAVLRIASLPEVPVKALRHGFSTHSVGIIAPVRIPTKPATHSDVKPATHSDAKAATIPT